MTVQEAIQAFQQDIDQGVEPDWNAYRVALTAGDWEAFIEQAIAIDIDQRRNRNVQLPDYSSIGPVAAKVFDTLQGRLEPAINDAKDATARPAGSDRKATPVEMPDSVGPYTIRERLGAGGMGEVFLADDSRNPGRRVALKVIRSEMVTPDGIARFRVESQILEAMNHPNISRVYESGQTEDKRNYIAMEFIHGAPITESCEFKQMTIRDRLQLFQACCQGIQHAHNNGVIHRDIKPSNILVTEVDNQSIVKIIDFGVAKSRFANQQTLRSQIGDIIGTLGYMSPEQAAGKKVDTTTDVYSLGVLLFELVTGALPHDLRQKSLVEAIRAVTEEDPIRPSLAVQSTVKRLDSSSKHRKAPTSKLLSDLRGDLDWIILKALAKDPARRYESPSALSQDIERFLTGAPVSARSDSLYRLGKSIRRYALGWAAGAAALLLAVVSFFFINDARLRASAAALKAEEANRLTQQSQTELKAKNQELQDAINAGDAARASLEETNEELKETNDTLASEPLRLRRSIAELSEFGQTIALYNAELAVRESKDEAVQLRQLDRQPKPQPLLLYPEATASRRISTQSLAFSPDGKVLASGDLFGNKVRLWDTATWEMTQVLNGHEWVDNDTKLAAGLDGTIQELLFSPTGSNTLYSAGLDGQLIAWDTVSGNLVRSWSSPGNMPITAAAFSSDNRAIWVGLRDGSLARVALTNLTEEFIYPDAHKVMLNSNAENVTKQISSMSVHSQQDLLASVGVDGVLKLWNWNGSELILKEAYQGPAPWNRVAFRPDGKQLAVTGVDGYVYLHNSSDLRDPVQLDVMKDSLEEKEPGRCMSLAWMDNNKLLSGGAEGVIRMWDVQRLEKVREFSGHDANPYGRNDILAIDISIENNTLVSVGRDDAIKIWDSFLAEERFSLEGSMMWVSSPLSKTTGAARLGHAPAANRLAALVDDSLTLFDATSLRVIHRIPVSMEELRNCIALDQDGTECLVGEESGEVSFYRFDGQQPMVNLAAHSLGDFAVPTIQNRMAAAWSPSDKSVVTIGDDRMLIVWDPIDKTQVKSFSIEDDNAKPLPPELFDDQVVFLSEHFCVTSGRDDFIRIWDTRSGDLISRTPAFGKCSTISLNRQSSRLAVGAEDGSVALFDVVHGEVPELTIQKLIQTKTQNDKLNSQVFDRDLKAGAASRKFTTIYQQHSMSFVNSLSWSPNSRLLSITHGDGVLSVLDDFTGKLLSQGFAIESKYNFLDSIEGYFLSTGELITASEDRSLRRWEIYRDEFEVLPFPAGTRSVDGGLGLIATRDGWLMNGYGDEGKNLQWRNGKPVVDPWPELTEVFVSLRTDVDRKRAAVTTLSGRLLLLDFETGALLNEFLKSTEVARGSDEDEQGSNSPEVVAISPDGSLVSSSDNGSDSPSVFLWSATSKEAITGTSLEQRNGPITAIAIHPSRDSLAIGQANGTVTICGFDGEKIQLRCELTGPENASSLLYSPDGSMLVAAGGLSNNQNDRSVVIWNPNNGAEVDVIVGQDSTTTEVSTLGHSIDWHQPVIEDLRRAPRLVVPGAAFSPDGEFFATCGADGRVNIWSVEGKRFTLYYTVSTVDLATLQGDLTDSQPMSPMSRTKLTHIAFSNDSSELAVAAEMGPVRLYRLADLKKKSLRTPEQIRADIEEIVGLRLEAKSLKAGTIEKNRLQPVIKTLE